MVVLFFLAAFVLVVGVFFGEELAEFGGLGGGEDFVELGVGSLEEFFGFGADGGFVAGGFGGVAEGLNFVLEVGEEVVGLFLLVGGEVELLEAVLEGFDGLGAGGAVADFGGEGGGGEEGEDEGQRERA